MIETVFNPEFSMIKSVKPEYDLVIRKGQIVDGTGAKGLRAILLLAMVLLEILGRSKASAKKK